MSNTYDSTPFMLGSLWTYLGMGWLVGAGCIFCGLNVKFVSRKCSGGRWGTEKTPFCNLQKLKTAQVLKNYFNGVLEYAYLVCLVWREEFWGFFLFLQEFWWT